MDQKFDVVGVGVCAVDYLGMIPSFPQPDTKTEMSELTMQGGGLVATALVTVSRLGGTAAYLGRVGDDAFGRFIVEEFEKEGVDTRGIALEPGGSAIFAFVVSDQQAGSRTIFWTRDRVPEIRDEDVTGELLTQGGLLHVDVYEAKAALAAARAAKDAHMPVTMDAEAGLPGADDLVDIADVIIASEAFALEKTEREDYVCAARTLFEQQMGVSRDKVVVVTAGTRGSYCVSADGEFHQPAFRAEVVDTTGCGDVYHGAFVFGLARGWELKRCAELASAVAALKCRKLGGRAGIPDFAEAEGFLKTAEPMAAG